jgi:hypothetical protein
MTDAEQAIKSRLDGTFTRCDPETGRIETARVPHDFRPYWRWGKSGNPSYTVSGRKGGTVSAANFRKSWSASEDEKLLSMFAMGHGSRFVSKMLMRSRTAVEYRLRCLIEVGD